MPPRSFADGEVVPLERLALTLAPFDWPFAREKRADIDAHFAALQARLAHVWNGRILLMREPVLADGVLHARFFETDYASFLAWRDWGWPTRDVINSFAMGALRAADGAYLLGEMAEGTANEGSVYFPCGTPDPSDTRGDTVDFAGSVFREVLEETGLSPDDYTAGGWVMVPAGPRLALIRVLQSAAPADALRARILQHLAREQTPELANIRIVRGPDDLDPAMPDFVEIFLRWAWRAVM